MEWIHGKASGGSYDINIGTGGYLSVYGVQYSTVQNSGTLDFLPGDLRTTSGGWGSGTANQLTFWDNGNQLKGINGISYESDLDSVSLVGTTIYGDHGETNLSRGYFDLRRMSDNYNPFLTFWRSRPVPPNSSAKVLSGDLLGRISALGHDGTDWASGSRARIDLAANQDWSSTAHGTRVSVQVTPNDSTTPTEVLRVDGTGVKNMLNNLVVVKDYTLEINAQGAENADKLDGQHGSYYTNADNIYLGSRNLSDWFAYFPQGTLRDHFTSSNLNTTAWVGWASGGIFGGAPDSALSYNHWGHYLRGAMSGAQQNLYSFLYADSSKYSRPNLYHAQCAADSNNTEVGLMIWQDDNNFIQLYIRGGYGTYSASDAALFKRSMIGGVETATQISSAFPGGTIMSLLIYLSGTNCFGYVSASYVPASYTTAISIPANFNPSRWGLFMRNLTNSGSRTGYVNYFATG